MHFYQKKRKTFRIDKKNPQRFKVTTEQDLGKHKIVETFTAAEIDRRSRIIPKKVGGNWQEITNHNGIKIRRAKDTGQIFIWAHDEYVGELRENDLANLGFDCLKGAGCLTLVINKKVKGRIYQRWMIKFGKGLRTYGKG
jgi:hypothetical protein